MNIKSIKLMSFYWVVVLTQVPITGILFRHNVSLGTISFGLLDALFLFLFAPRTRLVTLAPFASFLMPLVIYLLWSFLSILWSVSGTATYDFALLTKDLLRFLVVLCMSVNINKDSFLSMFFQSAGIAAFLFGILGLLSLDFVHEYSGGSYRALYLGYKDAVGVGRPASFLCLLAFIGLFSGLIKQRFMIICLFPCLIVVMLCFSKSSIIALIISLFLIYGLDKDKLIYSIYAIVVLAVVVVVIILFRGDYFIEYMNGAGGGNLESYSGRGPLWDALIDELDGNLLIGHGSNSIMPLLKKHHLDAGTAHNEILQQLITTGLIGLFLLMWVYFLYLVKAFNSPSKTIRKIMLTLFVFYAVVGVLESTLVTTVFPIYIIGLLMILSKPVMGEYKENKFVFYSIKSNTFVHDKKITTSVSH